MGIVSCHFEDCKKTANISNVWISIISKTNTDIGRSCNLYTFPPGKHFTLNNSISYFNNVQNILIKKESLLMTLFVIVKVYHSFTLEQQKKTVNIPSDQPLFSKGKLLAFHFHYASKRWSLVGAVLNTKNKRTSSSKTCVFSTSHVHMLFLCNFRTKKQ